VACSGRAYAPVTVPADGVASVQIVEPAPDTRPKHSAGLTVEQQLGGSLVTAVVPGSPADKAGIRVDDVIVELEGVPVGMFGDYLSELLDDLAPGRGTTLTYERGDQRLTAQLVVP
jgi:S1-C subfamily serine protease